MPFDPDRWLVETYEAIFDADAFYRQFEELAAAFKSVTCALHIEQPRAKALELVVGADPGIVANEYPKFRNLWIERSADTLMATGIAHDGLHTPLREMERTAYHRYLLKPLDIDHSVGVLCDQFPDGGFSMLSLSRPRRVGLYTDEDIEALKRLRPHFRALSRLHLRTLEQERRILDYKTLVARASMPRFILDEHLRMRFANSAAEILLEEGDLVTVGARDALSMADPLAQRQFSAKIIEGGAFELTLCSRASGRRAVLQLEPLKPPLRLGHSEVPGYLATLAPIGSAPVSPAQRLVYLFHLTGREAELAQALADTQRLRDAAECLGMRYETARSHLKKCFDKTGTSSQVELVALIRDLPVVPELDGGGL